MILTCPIVYYCSLYRIRQSTNLQFDDIITTEGGPLEINKLIQCWQFTKMLIIQTKWCNLQTEVNTVTPDCTYEILHLKVQKSQKNSTLGWNRLEQIAHNLQLTLHIHWVSDSPTLSVRLDLEIWDNIWAVEPRLSERGLHSSVRPCEIMCTCNSNHNVPWYVESGK